MRGTLLTLVLLAGVGAAAQDPQSIETPPAVDPYTGGAAEAMQRAGYVSFGDFGWGQDHGSAEIRSILGGIPILFVETEHFRIASTLGTYRGWTDSREKQRIGAELERLHAILPEVPSKTRELDPWLRLHVAALRLESLHADFFANVGRGPVDSLRRARPKFTVLLCQRSSDFNFYAESYLGAASRTPMRHVFGANGSIFYGCATEFMPAEANDAWLHCSMARGVAQNLLDSICPEGVPAWLTEGVAAWFSRRVDPRWNFYSLDPEQRVREDTFWQWEPKIRARALEGVAPGLLEVLAWEDPDALEPTELMMAWSRVDHLLAMSAAEGPQRGGFERLLEFLSAPPPHASRDSKHLALLERQLAGLQHAFGMGPAQLDEAWRTYVRRQYRR